MFELFEDREQAGRALAAALAHYRDEPGLLVLGLARGGLPVAAEVAAGLGAELDVLVIRKIRAPGHPELAIGAVGPDQVRVLNEDIITQMGISLAELVHATHKARAELTEREHRYRLKRPATPVRGRTVIIVDDGLATGASLEAAIASVRQGQATRIITAIPVGVPDAVQRLESRSDQLICLMAPKNFVAVSRWYRHFNQVSDDEVIACLNRFQKNTADGGPQSTDTHDSPHRPHHS
ncbi:phosphoribosyltransferase [Gammaproteobacteria bacterium AB-CW1]|jgi:putative phosphoribosyl transferase|uniref:Phosphoribosyltransferase n=1 Tax=Natronospira elongata TaxID=3110268 RepID=A0AAP6MKL4_9GAMM|nr:phosphoribosyltransferase [Gammaproteobacteria bacterium AB-CW1]